MRRQTKTGACDGKYSSILKGLLNVSNRRGEDFAAEGVSSLAAGPNAFFSAVEFLIIESVLQPRT